MDLFSYMKIWCIAVLWLFGNSGYAFNTSTQGRVGEDAECPVGKYGPGCEFDCPQFCGLSSNQTECDRSDGRCKNGCQAGRWGRWCEHKCGHCTDNKCLFTDGSCLKGCQTTEECGSHCKICTQIQSVCQECQTDFQLIDGKCVLKKQSDRLYCLGIDCKIFVAGFFIAVIIIIIDVLAKCRKTPFCRLVGGQTDSLAKSGATLSLTATTNLESSV